MLVEVEVMQLLLVQDLVALAEAVLEVVLVVLEQMEQLTQEVAVVVLVVIVVLEEAV
jgi:hypothetical protein